MLACFACRHRNGFLDCFERFARQACIVIVSGWRNIQAHLRGTAGNNEQKKEWQGKMLSNLLLSAELFYMARLVYS